MKETFLQRIGIFGGTFNPVHYGHLAAAEEVRERIGLDLVLFVPSSLPPHKSGEGLPSAIQRQEMVRLAITGNRFFALSEIEVRRGGRSYTIDTVDSLRSSHTDTDLFFITGLDSFLEIKTWHQWKLLLSQCAFVVLSRPGYHFSDLRRLDFMQQVAQELELLDRGATTGARVNMPGMNIHLEAVLTCDISSRDIRKRVRERRSFKYLLPDAVEQYIITNKLYA
jgi:nicotinate-nucleotide adenylyltransferase